MGNTVRGWLQGFMSSRSTAFAFFCLVAFSHLTSFLPLNSCFLVNAQPQHPCCVLLLLHKGRKALLKNDGVLDAAGIAAMEELHLQKKTDCKY